MGTESERTTANPGSPSRTSHCSAEEGCITCGDVAVELEVVELDADRGLALCRDEEDRRETVEIALVLPVEARDRLLVHAGTAIAHAAPSPSGTPGRAAEDFAPSPSGTPGRAAEDFAPSPSGTPGRAAEDFAPSPSGTPGRAAEEVAG